MPQADVALVVGANDVVNPAARTDKSSPIYGMPIIEADKARTIFAIKRSKNPDSRASTTSSISRTARGCCSATPRRSLATSSRSWRAAQGGTDESSKYKVQSSK
jgi:NAD/NADP transhydrogenase beta subunit